MKRLITGLVFTICAVNMSFAAACDSSCAFGPSVVAPYGTFNPTIFFNAGQPASTADVPTYLTPDATRLGGIVPAANMPMIHLNVLDPVTTGVGKTGTNVFYTLHVVCTFLPPAPVLAGQHLFILPATAGGLPTYVSSWSFNAGNATLDIMLDKPDAVDLVFGTLPNTPGQVVSTGNPVFNFSAAGTQSVALSISGSGFRTVNPFILATPVLAGAKAPKPIFSSTYPLKNAVASFGIHSLGSNLKADRIKASFSRMATAYVAIDTTAEKRSFPLNVNDTVGTGMMAAISGDTDVVVSGGNFSATLPVQISASGWKALGQASRSLEMALTVFDGGVVSRGKVLVQGNFQAGDIGPSDEPDAITFEKDIWNLYCYPWDEAKDGALSRVVQSASHFKAMRYTGTSYTDLLAADFSNFIDSGRAFWSGNLDFRYKPVTIGGKSLDTGTFVLPVVAGRWNDFGLPFNFPVRLKDIMNASAGVDTSFHIWPFNPGGTSSGGSWGKNFKPLVWASDTLFPWKGYTVYGKSAVSFKFPVRDASRSNAPLAKASANSLIWMAGLRVQNNTAVAGLEIGKGQPGTIEEAPSVPGQDFHALLRSGNRGWSVIHEDGTQGLEGHWPLQIIPGKGFSSLNLTVADRQGASIPLYLVETFKGVSVQLSNAPVTLTAQDVQEGDYHLVAGNAEYAQSFLKSVTNQFQLNLVNFPNPVFEAGTSIRFSLPATFSNVNYLVKIYDFQGKMVWEKAWQGGSLLNTFWDGRNLAGQQAPTGQYHLLVTAQVPGKSAIHAERNLVKLR